MKPDTRERIRTLVQSLHPTLSPSGLMLTIPVDNDLTQVSVSTNRDKRDSVKEYLAQCYFNLYGINMSYRTCVEVLREEKKKLQSIACKDLTPTTETPATETTDKTSGIPEMFEETPARGIYLHRATNTVLQRDSKTGNFYPIKEWSIPEIHSRYQITDTQGHTKVEYDMSIQGHRQTVDRTEISNTRYINRFPDLSNVETPYLRNAYATLISSEARKAPLIIKVRTTGMYPYTLDKKERLGYMYPTGKFLQSDGSFYPHTSLTRKMEAEELARWERFEQRIQVTDEQIAEAYHFIKQVSPTGLGLILLANYARSFAHFLTNDTFKSGHILYLYGEQGSGKTELTSFCRGLAQPYKHKAPLDATFRDTGASAEDDIDFYKDIPAIIDDLVKGPKESDSVMKYKEKTLENMGRAAYDGQPIRKRMTQSMSKQTHRYVRTLPVVTGEKYLENMAQSGHRRILSIEVERGQIFRKSLEENTQYALDNSEEYAYINFGWGRRIVLSLLRTVEHDKDNFLQQMEVRFKEYQKRVYDAVNQMWNAHQRIPFPHYADSLLDACSHIMIGARLLDHASHEMTTCVEDVFIPLIKMLYTHLCRMENIHPNEEGYTALQMSLVDLYEGMAKGRSFRIYGNTETIKAESYNSRDVPHIQYAQGEVIPETQWGYGLSDAVIRSKVAIYIRQETDKLYITSVGLQALITLLSEHDVHRDIDSISMVTQLLYKEGWILDTDKGEGKHLQKKIRRLGVCERVAVISLSKFLELVDAGVPEDASPQTEDNIIYMPTRKLTVNSILAN